MTPETAASVRDHGRAAMSTAITAAPDARDFTSELLALIPQVRGFARTLSGEWDAGEDLAQETLAKAWRHQRAYHAGTNLRAWLFTIARNEFYSSRRRARNRAPYDQAQAENIPAPGAAQVWSTELADTLEAVSSLPHRLRNPLLLVGAHGCSYAEVAASCGCPVGTAKSRVSRARRALAEILDPPALAQGPLSSALAAGHCDLPQTELRLADSPGPS